MGKLPGSWGCCRAGTLGDFVPGQQQGEVSKGQLWLTQQWSIGEVWVEVTRQDRVAQCRVSFLLVGLGR